jgi:putative nucleotidyltransferase with HDIG domain
MAISLTIRRIITAQPADLPVFHPIAIRLQQILESLDFTVDEVITVASEDQSLASKILKVANSPFYLGRVPVVTIRDAVVRLGAQLVSNLAMVASQSSIYSSRHELINRYMQKLWSHSHACAVGCRFLANNANLSHLAEQAYMAGLLHDVGKLYLLKALERLNEAGVAQAALEEELLLEIFAELHVEQGVRLMEHWRLPVVYRDAVASHHEAEWDTTDDVLAIVRTVNAVCRRKGISLHHEPHLNVLGLLESQLLRLTEYQLAELETVVEDAQQPGF